MQARNPTEFELEALIRAQDIVYDALEAPSLGETVALARKALAISPLCADALTILADAEEPESDARLRLLHDALDAGERSLGPEGFAEFDGHFWGFLETRPYMRAREGLAMALWHAGRTGDAISHFQDMLRLNPNDNQGVRYALAACLAEADRWDDLLALEQTYPEEGSALLAWPMALGAFRRFGAGSEADERLSLALQSNRHVATYLLDKRRRPKELPAFYGMGNTNEAHIYVVQYGMAWETTPGAREWLRSKAGKARASGARSGRRARK